MAAALVILSLFAGNPLPIIDGVPRFASKPSYGELLAAYPPGALRLHLAGRVLMECRVVADGRLADCIVVEETPRKMGFGEAALGLAPYFRLRGLGAGPLIEGSVRIPLAWNPPE